MISIAIAITSVYTSTASVSSDSLVTVKVETSGDVALAVVARVVDNMVVIPLLRYSNTQWGKQIFGSSMGECTNSVFQIIASDGISSAIDATKTISVTETDPPRPMEFIENMLVSNWNPATAHGVEMPEHACVTSVKRLNRDRDWIVLVEGERVTETRGRGYYNNITYPVTIEMHSKDETRAHWILKEVDRIMESHWNNTGSYKYDYMQFSNKGKNVSIASAKIWKFIYNVELIKIFEPMEGVNE